MKTFFYNLGYFLLETWRIIRFNTLSNIFSVLGTGLILFLLGMAIAGQSIGNTLISAIQKEAQISAYFSEGTDEKAAMNLTERVKGLQGILEASYIDKEAAYDHSREMLGKEADILDLFDENPFEAYMDIRINLEDMDGVLDNVSGLNGIEYVRDNRDILKKIKGIVDGLSLLGLLTGTAVGITTVITISHMIRQGIYNNREQINTLKLLGAPNIFIGFPFILAGTFLTFLGGIMAVVMLLLLMNLGYNGLSDSILFLPLPPVGEIREMTARFIFIISAGLGLAGSLFGLTSIKQHKVG